MSGRCPVCGHPTKIYFEATVLREYRADYFFCRACGLLQSEHPFWLEKAYAAAIAAEDTGLVRRNLQASRILAPLLLFLFGRRGKYLDIAGGTGLLVRLMRDSGFDFYWSDKYCGNTFARGFESESTSPPFTAVTALEVMEHISDPLAFLGQSLGEAQSRTIIFSTELYRGDRPPRPEDWWYYAFSSGQHVSFYNPRTLRAIAAGIGLRLYLGSGIHMFSERSLSPGVFRLLTSRLALPLAPAVRPFLRSRTKSGPARPKKKREVVTVRKLR